jgi:serine protease Do
MRNGITTVAAALALGIGIGCGQAMVGNGASPPAEAQGAAVGGEAAVVQAARVVTPAVVGIATQTGAGSGVIIRPDGVILTNAHVVGNARQVQVGLADGRQLTGQVLGQDPSIDIAVVRVTAAGLPAAQVGDSDLLEPGQLAIAIGNPAGFERTVTTGVVSGINRALAAGLEELIQTDAAINPGNSGGPLLDSSGRVIGINTAVMRDTRGGPTLVGLGFAVPINLANSIAEQLLTTGVIRRAYLGVSYQEITPEIVRRFRVPVQQGLLLLTVDPRSPAGQAGLARGDILVGLDGQAITMGGDLRRVLRERRAGDTVRLTVQRADRTFDLNVRLTEIQIGR